MVRRLPNGNLLVPRRAEGPGIVGDGWFEIGPDHPDYAANNAWLERMEKIITKTDPAARRKRKRKGKRNA
jgi:hypothetical protein